MFFHTGTFPSKGSCLINVFSQNPVSAGVIKHCAFQHAPHLDKFVYIPFTDLSGVHGMEAAWNHCIMLEGDI